MIYRININRGTIKLNKTHKILLGILLLIIIFVLSAFGMYKYNEYSESKVFNSLASQGKQYMIGKDYDKAIQTFKKALSYKNDPDIQNNLALAQSLKDENAKKQEISKDIQLANDAAKNSKYDDANKYLDEVLKIDPNNSEAKGLKDAFAKAVQEQQEKDNQTSKYEKVSKNKSENSELTYEQAYQIVQSILKKEFKNTNISAIPLDEIPEKFRGDMIQGDCYIVGTMIDNDYGGPDYQINKYTGKIIEYSQGTRKDIN